jgi:signal transduction histidine kinase
VPDPQDLVERLAAHRLVGAAPRSELAWLAEHGRLRRLEAGEAVVPFSATMFDLFVLFSGRISVYVDRSGAAPKKVMEWRGGDVTGLLPYSRATVTPGPTVAEEPTEVLVLERGHFPELIRECYGLTSIFVHVMIDRARLFTRSDLQEEKMQSLGRLAAGLAHELNNPASAVARSASALPSSLTAAVRAARALGAAELSAPEITAVDQFCASYRIDPTQRHSAIDKADREDAIESWLDKHGLDDTHAESLADSTVPPAELDQLASALHGAALQIAIDYVTSNYATRRLTAEIERAASRISELVSAIKRFSYMDQAGIPKPVNVRQDLQDTLLMLNAKAKQKGATLTLDVEGDLPSIQAFGGELNQVWANLVDNALDAVPAGGHVAVSAARHNDTVVVRVVDDGPGIPNAIQDRIFDPFFTTKTVGEGTGLGLDIVRRILRRHDAQIEVNSVPGRTEFLVTVPIDAKLRAEASAPSGDHE